MDDSSDEELDAVVALDLLNFGHIGVRQPREFRWRQNNEFPNRPEKLERRFKLSEETLEELCQVLHADLQQDTTRNMALSVRECVSEFRLF